MSPAQTAAPLPECKVCEGPMRRESYALNDGICPPCQRAERRAAALEKRYLW